MNDVVDENVVNSLPTLGERLRSAREAKKFTVAEVAAQLRLPQETVVHLEEQQWEQLHGRIYARGYFSAYVKFLGLPYDEMLAIFNLEYKSSKADTVYQQNDKKPVSGLVSLLLFSVVIAACWFGYQYWLQENVANIDELSELQQNQDDQQEFEDFSDSVVEPLPYEETQQIQDEFTATPLSEQQQYEFAPEAESVVEQEISTDLPVVEIEDQQVETELEIAEVLEIELENEQQQAIAVADESEIIDSVAEATLELVFLQDCWVEVNDTHSKILLNKTMLANETIVLVGPPPLSVLLGNASAVLVKFNGVGFDTSPHTRGEVARFTLGIDS